MSGLPQFLTRGLTELPRTVGLREPHLDRSHLVDSLGISTVFIALVTSLPAVIPGNLMLRALIAAAIAWGFSEAYTRRRPLAIPSILTALIFAEMTLVIAALMIPGVEVRDMVPDLVGLAQSHPGGLSLACLATGAVILAHYRVMRAPIDPALAAAAWTAAVMLGARALSPEMMGYVAHFVAAGCAWLTLSAAVAMDVSDPRRETRGSDVAFWLHVAAALTLAYAIFVCGGVLKEITAFLALSIFATLGMAVNRYVILTFAKFGLVVVLAIAVSAQSAQLAIVALMALAILMYAHFERRRIRRRLIERTLPEIAPILPPVEDDHD